MKVLNGSRSKFSVLIVWHNDEDWCVLFAQNAMAADAAAKYRFAIFILFLRQRMT